MKYGSLFALLLSLLVFVPEAVAAKALTLGGYSLSMTIAEVKAIDPNATFTEIRPDPDGSIIGIRGESHKANLYFTPAERGGILFRVEEVTVFENAPNLERLMGDLISRYGKPAQAGRDMMYHLACWGACPGTGAKLLFRLKTFHPIKVDHRMTLTLVNTQMELKNKDVYRSAHEHRKK